MNPTLKKYGYQIVIVLLLGYILIQGFCSRDSEGSGTTTQKVIIPEKQGSFTKPTAIINHKGKKDSIVVKGKTVYTENLFNKKLAEDFVKSQEENDSLRTLNLYLSAIQEKEKTFTFDNKDMKLEVYTKTRGEILDIKPKYTMKERELEVQVKQKEQVLALYLGAGISDNKSLDNFAAEVELGIQTKSGDIISAGYDTQKNISLKFTKRIFKITK